MSLTKPPTPIYTPSPELHTYLDDFREYLNRRHDVQMQTYDDLHAFSIGAHGPTREMFWMSLWYYLEIKASCQPSTAVDETRAISTFPEFYQGARLNFAENILSQRGERTAIKVLSEANPEEGAENVSWDQLREHVRIFADALSSSGLKKGDTVVVIGGNNKVSIVLMLAAASMGAVFSSFATDVGEQALLDRLKQLGPRFLFTETEYTYNGKRHKILRKVSSIWREITKPAHAELITTTPHDDEAQLIQLELFLKRGTGKPLAFLQLPFNTPLFVMFSSGTTGAPKAIVHSHGGTIVNLKKEYRLHCNFDDEDVYYHYTNIGWALWNIMVGALFCGSTVVLYDGSPFYPSAERCLQRILSAGVTSFGAGPKYFSELQRRNIHVRSMANNRLNLLLSTGAVLTPVLSSWMAGSFGPLCQISFSGGTELCGSFVHGTVGLPTYPGEITVKALGMSVHVYSTPSGSSPSRPLPAGESGELVCTQPFPNMPVHFLHDPGRKRYFNAYFSAIPFVWTHGDHMCVSPRTGGIYILGRSDGVLNPAGIRFGSAEIYALIERQFAKDVVDSICVGQQRPGDETEKVILFVVLRSNLSEGSGAEGSKWQGLKKRIEDCIAHDLSRRHVPYAIYPVSRIPYNANGKKMEIPLKAVLSEGKQAFVKRNFTAEEIDVLRGYVQYYEKGGVSVNDAAVRSKL